jgi:hypothetical protein
MNTLGFPMNCCQGSGGGTPIIPSNYLYNVSSVGATTQGSIPVYDGSTLGETQVASEIRQTNTGITITNDLNVGNITTSTVTDLNGTIYNITQLLYNLTNIQTKV